MVKLKNSKKTPTPYFLPVMENEFQDFTTKITNIIDSDLYWTKIPIKPLQSFQNYQKYYNCIYFNADFKIERFH